MTLSESILWSFARSVIVAGIALWPVALLVQQIETSVSLRARRIWLLLSVFPFFVPELLIGFSYRLTATQLSLGSSPLFAATCTELLYSLLQISRCTAVGVAVSLLLPRSEVSGESLHVWTLLRSSIDSQHWWRGWLALNVFGPWQPLVISWSVMALISFQEFETAALMQIDRHPIAWSVWLFDAHAARQPLADSLRMTVLPLVCEALLLCPVLLMLLRSYSRLSLDAASFGTSALPGSRNRWSTAALLLFPGIVLMLLWPTFDNLKAAVVGVFSILTQSSLLQQSIQQILASTVFAAAATFIAMTVAIRLCSWRSLATGNPGSRLLLIMLMLPGLTGSLVMSLLLLAVFQSPMMRLLYDTWLPMLAGQTLAVFPKAFAVVILLRKITDRTAIHSARLLLVSPDLKTRQGGSMILWRMATSRWLLGGLVVAHWCFWDVTVASILRPLELEPVVTRLYNEMHYGRTEALIGLSAVAAVIPLVIWMITVLVIRVSRWLIGPRRNVR